MKSLEEKQKLAESQGARKKPRFKIEKLEERIAPSRNFALGPGHGVNHNHRHYPCGRYGCR